ncbi:unannotated protein [freshwater metagenome]|uniref:Unannotated protein n=1 Tax=freshwater metagenome TaxID=449393 RepID=A0A6J7J8A9_9ZZZZ|nr:PAS domain-containing protein [Actinomycetota bacterium]
MPPGPSLSAEARVIETVSRASASMVALDSQRNYLAVSDAYLRLIRRRRADIIGTPFDHQTPETSLDGLEDRWRRFLETGSDIGTFDMVGPDGETIRYRMSAMTDVAPGVHLSVTTDGEIIDGPAVPGFRVGHDVSPRERTILWLLMDGATGAQIAYALGISEQTVQKHVANVKRKLGAVTRSRAVVLALRDGVLEPSVIEDHIAIHEIIRGADGGIADTVLRYISGDLVQSSPQLSVNVGRPHRAWSPGFLESDIFACMVQVDAVQEAREFHGAALHHAGLPSAQWEGVVVPLLNDRIAVRGHMA